MRATVMAIVVAVVCGACAGDEDDNDRGGFVRADAGSPCYYTAQRTPQCITCGQQGSIQVNVCNSGLSCLTCESSRRQGNGCFVDGVLRECVRTCPANSGPPTCD